MKGLYKTEQAKPTKWKRAPTFLIVALVTVSACGAMPIEPHDPVFQPIVEQKFCQPDDPQNCEVKSLCREYRFNGQGDYELFQTWELKKCSGVFGQTANAYNKKKDFIRELTKWAQDIAKNCKAVMQ
jgi:hypothetical protein